MCPCGPDLHYRQDYTTDNSLPSFANSTQFHCRSWGSAISFLTDALPRRRWNVCATAWSPLPTWFNATVELDPKKFHCTGISLYVIDCEEHPTQMVNHLGQSIARSKIDWWRYRHLGDISLRHEHGRVVRLNSALIMVALFVDHGRVRNSLQIQLKKVKEPCSMVRPGRLSGWFSLADINRTSFAMKFLSSWCLTPNPEYPKLRLYDISVFSSRGLRHISW